MTSLPSNERALPPLVVRDLNERSFGSVLVGPYRDSADRQAFVGLAGLKLGGWRIPDALAALHPRHIAGPVAFAGRGILPAVRNARAPVGAEASPTEPMRFDAERLAALLTIDLHVGILSQDRLDSLIYARAAEQEIGMPSLFDIIDANEREAA